MATVDAKIGYAPSPDGTSRAVGKLIEVAVGTKTLGWDMDSDESDPNIEVLFRNRVGFPWPTDDADIPSNMSSEHRQRTAHWAIYVDSDGTSGAWDIEFVGGQVLYYVDQRIAARGGVFGHKDY
jgi:hypothetical protein